MKINILLPNVTRHPSGGHKVVYEYANKLAEDGVDVYIYYFSTGFLTNYNLPHALKKGAIKFYGEIIGPRQWFKLDHRIKTRVIDSETNMRAADALIVTSVETALSAKNILSKYIKCVYFVQDFENWNVDNDTVKKSYALNVEIVVIAQWIKKIVDKYSTQPSHLIPDGININVFKNLNYDRTTHSIVFQYRSDKHKGCSYAIEAIKKLKVEYPDLMVNVITSESQTPDFPEYCRCYHNLTAKQVAEINNKSEVFICTSIEEGFGLPGLEAMGCGCAVASSRYTGVLEYAYDEKNALLSPVKDIDALVGNVERLFNDEALRNKIIEEGMKTAQERSFDNAYKKFKKVLLAEQ